MASENLHPAIRPRFEWLFFLVLICNNSYIPTFAACNDELSCKFLLSTNFATSGFFDHAMIESDRLDARKATPLCGESQLNFSSFIEVHGRSRLSPCLQCLACERKIVILAKLTSPQLFTITPVVPLILCKIRLLTYKAMMF